ncbi:25441_t:CDS:2, partial [Gigaspora rosea]
MRTILHLIFIIIFITFLLGDCSEAKKIDINNRNLSHRHNGGSISSDSSVERRLNRFQIRAGPQKDPDTTTTKPPKAQGTQGSNSINPSQKPVSNGKMLPDKSSVSDANDANAQPTVVTDSSPPLVAGIAAFGCVCVVVVGIFMVVNKRKRRELTDNIPIGSYTVIDTFVPTLPDELDIQLGDKVTVLVVYDDGWVQGVNETQGGVKGVFPQHCVNMKVSFNVNNKRSSSMDRTRSLKTELVENSIDSIRRLPKTKEAFRNMAVGDTLE